MSKFCVKPFIIAHFSVITYQIVFRFVHEISIALPFIKVF